MEELPVPEALAPYMGLIQNAVIAIVILIGAWIVAKWTFAITLRVLRRKQLDESVSRFLSALVQYGVLAAGIIAALNTAGVQTTSFVALLGSAGLAIGLALQGSLGHFASGVMLLLFRPFTVGDVVTLAGNTGKVEEVGLFATTVITFDNETVIIPNGSVTSGTVVNLTVRGTRRGSVDIGLAYGVKIEDAMRVLTQAVDSSPHVLSDPAPAVVFMGFGASALDFRVFAWTQAGDYGAMLHGLRERMYNALNEAGIDIPFQQIVVRQP